MLMVQPNGTPLAQGDSVVLAFPTTGSTWRVEAEQEPHHPGQSQPAVAVEGCASGSFTTGFVSQFSQDDADPWLDIDCTPNIGSYDPNDKQGFPVGYGPTHLIEPGTEIEYLIRFQNTGTDTAFNVVVLDTLTSWLDPTTLRPGPSSHPYAFDLYGPGILRFTFENILLPDSNVNEPLSHGFVRFAVKPRGETPLSEPIENRAAIYFDFNEPVLTNTTVHHLGVDFITLVWRPEQPGVRVTASPNPFSDQTRLEIEGLSGSGAVELSVFDWLGRQVYAASSPEPVLTLRRGALTAGTYRFRLEQRGRILANGKLMVID